MFHRGWRATWTHIVAGKFSDAPYDGLLFYEQSNGYAEFWETDGYGGVSFLKSHSDWSWTHIVPYTGRSFYIALTCGVVWSGCRTAGPSVDS